MSDQQITIPVCELSGTPAQISYATDVRTQLLAAIDREIASESDLATRWGQPVARVVSRLQTVKNRITGIKDASWLLAAKQFSARQLADLLVENEADLLAKGFPDESTVAWGLQTPTFYGHPKTA